MTDVASAATAAGRVARVLMYGGTALALAGATAWALDVIPPLPEWMLRIAVYKLTLFGGAGMLVAGAALRRALGDVARAREADRASGELGAGAAQPAQQSAREAVPVEQDRSRQ